MSVQYSLGLEHLKFNPLTDGQLTQPMSDLELNALFDFMPDTGRFNRAWSFFMLQNGITEYYTTDYIARMAQYLGKRATAIQSATNERPRIAEVAAGRGLLSLLVGDELQRHGCDVSIVASDNRSWERLGVAAPLPHVQEEDYRVTLAREQPHIVLGAWLPSSVDFSPAFRAAGVDEYILIGNTEGVNRHGALATWGLGAFLEPVAIPEYQRDGYTRQTLGMPPQYYNSMAVGSVPSQTVSFHKEAQP